MKKIIVAIMIAALLLTGCSNGVSQAEYDKVVAERDAFVEQTNSIAEKSISGYSAPNFETDDTEAQSVYLEGVVTSCTVGKETLLTPITITLNSDGTTWKVTAGYTEYNSKEVIDKLVNESITVFGTSIVKSYSINADAILWNGKCFAISGYNENHLITSFPETESESESKPDIEAKEKPVIYEDDNAKISFVSASIDEVVFYVENKTSYVLTLQMRALSFDEVQTIENSSMSEKISPKSSGKAKLSITEGYVNTSALEKMSGQFAIAIDTPKREIYEPSFVDVPIK